MSEATEVSQEAPKPRGNWRPVWLALGAIVGVTAAIPLFGASVLVGPYLRDDWRLDHLVRAVALDWRDFGLDKAKERLQFELDRQGIGEQIGDDTCRFVETGGDRTIGCQWAVDVRIPGFDTVWPLSFESHARITAAGDLL